MAEDATFSGSGMGGFSPFFGLVLSPFLPFLEDLEGEGGNSREGRGFDEVEIEESRFFIR